MGRKFDELIRSARGETPADVVLRGGKVINTLTGEIYPADVALKGKYIVGVGDGYEAETVIDVDGLFVAPGFIDAHCHIESSMVTVPNFARAVVPKGTTSVVADPHELANVLGYDGIRYILESSKFNPLNVFIMLPSCVPATPLETAGSTLRAFDIFPFFKEKWVLGLGEMMNFPGVLSCDRDVLDKIKIAHPKRIDGHAPGLSGKDLNGYVVTGIASDHECTTADEAREKLRAGMFLMIREGTAAKNLDALLPAVTPGNSHRCLFCTDDRHPQDIIEQGHVNYLVNSAIAKGLNPITAIQMGTINTARYYMLNYLGAVAPGYEADLVVFESLDHVEPMKVFKNGQLVADAGEIVCEDVPKPEFPLRSSMNIRWLEGDEFAVPATGKTLRVIEVEEDSIVTKEGRAPATVVSGMAVADPERDLLKLVVVERHLASGNVGKAFVRGFGLRKGALASSISHDTHNVIAVGATDLDLQRAVAHVNKLGGGLVVVSSGEVLADVPLPIGGLMSRDSLEDVSKSIKSINAIARELGSKLDDPFMALSFLALPVIPKLKITDRGLVDVDLFDFVDLFVD